MTTKTKYLITVVGTTAIGKTSLAIKLAQHFNTEIISADSRQFFKEMSIGTAVPSKEELKSAPHHFIQHISIFDSYSVGDFERDALKKLDELFQKHTIVIMAGGSGLYVDAVLKGLDNFPDVDPIIREQLNSEFQEKGIEPLQEQLQNLDPEHYNKIDIHNPHRLIRALEICVGTGKTYSSFLNQPKPERPFKSIIVGLTADRDIIYGRINKRVDIMVKNGLVEEAKQLFQHRELNALQTVGYRELFNYFSGEWELDFAISEIKKNTRRFAKRQQTWFKKNEDILWFQHSSDAFEVINKVSKLIASKNSL